MRSRLAAYRNNCSSVHPDAGTIETTFGLPSVSVPVLSTMSVVTFSSVSNASACLINTPAFAPRPAATIMAMGVANPRAHGHAIMSTATSLTNAFESCGCGPTKNHTKNVITATAITVGTKYPAT